MKPAPTKYSTTKTSTNQLPKIQDLYSDKLTVQKQDLFMSLMNQEPKKECRSN